MKYDLAVIGGGPAGYNAAEKAAINGLNTVLFEKKYIGGVCLNEGCIPTKAMLYSAKVLDSAKHAEKYGIKIEGQSSFDLEKIISRKDKTVKKLTSGVNMKLKSNGVTIVEGKAKIKGHSGNPAETGIDSTNSYSIEIECNNESYEVKYLLLCSGSEAIIPPIKGLSDVDFWTSKEALEVSILPEKLVIIGGGVIGMEFASFFNSMGVKVFVVEMMDEILGGMDKETSKMLRNEYTKKGVVFHLKSKVTEVTSGFVVIEKNGETTKIETDRVLLSVGRKAVFIKEEMDKIGIKYDNKGVIVNEVMQTSNPRVFASGDITGFSMLAHTAIREGEVAINYISGYDDRMSYKAIPGVVYTNPEIAGVGKTEEELKQLGVDYKALKLPMAYSGRFVAENEGGNGLMKLIIDQDEKVIGCHMLGNPASELIVIAGIAIEKGMTVEEFQKIVFPHPTVAEIYHESL